MLVLFLGHRSYGGWLSSDVPLIFLEALLGSSDSKSPYLTFIEINKVTTPKTKMDNFMMVLCFYISDCGTWPLDENEGLSA